MLFLKRLHFLVPTTFYARNEKEKKKKKRRKIKLTEKGMKTLVERNIICAVFQSHPVLRLSNFSLLLVRLDKASF